MFGVKYRHVRGVEVATRFSRAATRKGSEDQARNGVFFDSLRYRWRLSVLSVSYPAMLCPKNDPLIEQLLIGWSADFAVQGERERPTRRR